MARWGSVSISSLITASLAGECSSTSQAGSSALANSIRSTPGRSRSMTSTLCSMRRESNSRTATSCVCGQPGAGVTLRSPKPERATYAQAPTFAGLAGGRGHGPVLVEHPPSGDLRGQPCRRGCARRPSDRVAAPTVASDSRYGAGRDVRLRDAAQRVPRREPVDVLLRGRAAQDPGRAGLTRKRPRDSVDEASRCWWLVYRPHDRRVVSTGRRVSC